MEQYTGEIISLIVALSWTATALFADIASHRLGALPLNLIRMALSLVMLGTLLWVSAGSPFPVHADVATWFWLLLSGLVGYVFGDFCLFNSYVIFGSRYGQLFMTLAPPLAGIAGWLMLGERMSLHSWLAMLVTLTGIAISILVRGGGESRHRVELKLPLKGVLFGVGAGVGQGVGLVLSKIGLEHYAMVLPDDAPQVMSAMMPFFGPFIGVSLSLMAVQYAEAGIASTLMALTPVLIIAPYAWIYHQKVTVKEIFGTLVTIIGVAMFFML